MIPDVGSGRAPGPAAVTEVRVHGVGGSPGPALLGVRHPEDAPVIGRHHGIVVRARRDPPDAPVEGFDWGALTSGSPLHALWIVLLPFTLINVAGWAHPRREQEAYRGQTTLTHGIVTFLGWLLTATWTLWLLDVLVGYAAYQWVPRATGGEAKVIPLLPFGWWRVSLTPTGVRAVAVAAAAVVGLLLLGGVATLARRTAVRVREPQAMAPPGAAPTFERHDEVFDDAFFDKRRPVPASTAVHLVIAAAMVVLVVGQAAASLRRGAPSRLPLDEVLVFVGGLQLTFLFLLGAGAWLIPWLIRRRAAEPAPATYRAGAAATAAATLAFALTNAFFSGTVLLVTRYLADHPKVTASPRLDLGRELATVDAFLLVVVLWAALAVAVALRRRRLRGLPQSCNSNDEIPEGWRSKVAAAQGTARIVHRADSLAAAFAAVFWVIGVGIALSRVERPAGTWLPWRWVLEPPDGRGLAYSAAAWLLPVAVAYAVARVRQAARDTRLRRFLGQTWDVLTFWPRRFHPFAVRPYAQLAVPALRGRVRTLLEAGPVLVSAHSQGSVLAIAALSPLDESNLERVALVTYGSPASGIYQRVFPAYFNPAQVAGLRAKLPGPAAGRWHNFFRLTDPIGRPMFGSAVGSGRDPADHCLPDPALAVSGADGPPDVSPPLERDREPLADLAGHSFYLNEPTLKRCVEALKAELAPSRASEG